MGVTAEVLREARFEREAARGAEIPKMLEELDVPTPVRAVQAEPRYKVLTVTSNKGGVGKTTLSVNLAVYLRALREDLPVLVLGLDDQELIDRMFELEDGEAARNVASCLRSGNFSNAVRLGQYGVHYVPSSAQIGELKHEVDDPLSLRSALDATGWEGLVVVDTKSDLEILTQSAIAASDLVLVPVKDDAALREAAKLYELLDAWGRPRACAHVVLSIIDRRIKYRHQETGRQEDVLGLLVSEIRRLGYPLMESFVSSSPKVEALCTNPDDRALPVLTSAPYSIVHTQLRVLAEEVLKRMDTTPPWKAPDALRPAANQVSVRARLEARETMAERQRAAQEVLAQWHTDRQRRAPALSGGRLRRGFRRLLLDGEPATGS